MQRAICILAHARVSGCLQRDGLLGGGPNGAPWLFNFWRMSFALAVISYVFLKESDNRVSRLTKNGLSPPIVVTMLCSLAVTAALTWLATAGNGYLPNLYVGTAQQASFNQEFAGALWVLNVIALVLLFARTRTILDVWLAVTVLMALPDYSLAFFYSGLRFSLGWYTARSFVLVGSCMLLTVLLVETTLLYSRLASAITLQRRERTHRLLSVDEATSAIAHEINQPLAAITLNCEAMLLALKRAPPDAHELKETVQDTLADGRRAGDIVAAVRALFKSSVTQRTKVDVNRLIRQVLRMVENDLQVHGVAVSTEFEQDVQHTIADPTQLQQVVLNLVKNAIEAMAVVPPPRGHFGW